MSIVVEVTRASIFYDITSQIKVDGCLLRYVNGSTDYKYAPDLFDFTIKGTSTLMINYLITRYRRERIIVYNSDKTEVLFDGYTLPYNDSSFTDDYGNLTLSATDRLAIELDIPCGDLTYREQTLKFIAEDICDRVSLEHDFPADLDNLVIPFFVRDANEERYLPALDKLLWEYGYTLYARYGTPTVATVRKWFHDIPDQFASDRFINPDSALSMRIIEPFDITEEELEHQIVAVEAKQLKQYIIDSEEFVSTGIRLYLERSEDPTKNPVAVFNGPGIYPIDGEVKLTYQDYNISAAASERFNTDSRLLYAWDQGLYYRYLVGDETYDEIITEPWPLTPPYLSPGGITPEVIEHYSKRSRVVLTSLRVVAPDKDTVFQDVTLNRTTDGNFRRRWGGDESLDNIIVGDNDVRVTLIEIGASGDIYLYFSTSVPRFAKNETEVTVISSSDQSKKVKFRLSGRNPYTSDNSDTREVYQTNPNQIIIRFTPRYETAIADNLAKLAAFEIRGSAFVQHGTLKIRDGVDSVSVRFDAVSVTHGVGRVSYELPDDELDPNDPTAILVDGASTEDDFYNNWRLVSEFGTNLFILDYDGATRTATVEGIVQDGDVAGTRLSLISPTLGVTEEEVKTSNIYSRDYKLAEGVNLTFDEIYEDAFNLGEGFRNLREYGRYLFKFSTSVNSSKLPSIGDVYKLRYDKYGILTTVICHSLEYLPDDVDNPNARVIFKKIGNFDPSRSYIEAASVPSILQEEPLIVKSYIPNQPELTVRVEANNTYMDWNSQPGLQNFSHHELQIAESVNGPWFAPDYTGQSWMIGQENEFLSIYSYEFVQVNLSFNSTFYYRIRRSLVNDTKGAWSDVVEATIDSPPSAAGVQLEEVIYAESTDLDLTSTQLPDNSWLYKTYGTVDGVEWSGTLPDQQFEE